MLELPSQPHDLNPIENLWKTLKLRVHVRDPKNITKLKNFVKENGKTASKHL